MLVTTSPLVKTYMLEEFWELPEPTDRFKLELIRGVLYKVPLPDEHAHESAVSHAVMLLVLELDRLGNPGQVYVPRAGIWTYHPDTWLEPDCFYLSNKSIAGFKDRPRSSADLVIEVVSPGSADYDRMTKADTYAALGVKDLWLVDPMKRTIAVRLNEGKKWGGPRLYHEGEAIVCQAIPGLKLAVAAIFSDIA
jgi:Uma2 family endonuclease